jgi:hypothetical protein
MYIISFSFVCGFTLETILVHRDTWAIATTAALRHHYSTGCGDHGSKPTITKTKQQQQQ